MILQEVLAIKLARMITRLTRLFHLGGGSAAPGLYALKIYPQLIENLSQQIPQTIIITGTNGKTTTARILGHFAQREGLRVLRNSTGSNLERGVASALISAADLKSYDLAIWELDEAAFNSLAPKLKPKVIVFLNVFRDQLDRYGEVDSIVKKWGRTLKKIDKKTKILLNGDDANILKLTQSFKGGVKTFGVSGGKIVGELGTGKRRGDLSFEAKDIKLRGLSSSKFSTVIDHKSLIINLPLPGLYHVYDFMAAMACGLSLNFDPQKMVSSLKKFSPAFGRVEKFELPPLGWQAKREGYIFLIKNPTGATQVFQTIAGEIRKNDRILLALNDNLADGTDVSWIWDANFELLATSLRCQFLVSGQRAADLAVRLKYAGLNIQEFTVEENLEQAFRLAVKNLPGRLFVLLTYTALLKFQKILVKSGIKTPYWKEER